MPRCASFHGGAPQGYPGEKPGKDMIMECKKAVIRAALGIQALDESQLLNRLEDLYLAGVKAGVEVSRT